jgi:hypothetical protein
LTTLSLIAQREHVVDDFLGVHSRGMSVRGNKSNTSLTEADAKIWKRGKGVKQLG